MSSSTFGDPLPSILPRHSINLLAAASGVGKTALLASLLSQLHRGESVFGHAPNGIAGFGYISADRPWHSDSRLWFEAAGFPEILHYSMVDDETFPTNNLRDKTKRVEVLDSFFAKLALPRGSLVVIDPLALFLGGDLLNYDMCARACIEIQRLLKKRDLTAIGLVHAAKQKTDTKDRYLRPQDRILGSMALLGFSSTQMYLGAPEEMANEDGHYTFAWNPHHAPAASFLLRRLENGLFAHVEAASGPTAVPDDTQGPVEVRPQPLSDLPSFAQQLVKDIPWAPGSIATPKLLEAVVPRLGSRPTVFRHLQELLVAGHVQQPKRGVWQRVAAEIGQVSGGESPKS